MTRTHTWTPPQEFVREAACAHLDTDKSLREQSLAELRLVKEEVSFPHPYMLHISSVFHAC